MERVNTAPSKSTGFSIRWISFEPSTQVKAKKLGKGIASNIKLGKAKEHFTAVDSVEKRMPRCILKDGEYKIIKNADIKDKDKKASMVNYANRQDQEMDI